MIRDSWRITLGLYKLRVKWLFVRLVQLLGFGLMLLGVWSFFSQSVTVQSSRLLGEIPQQTFVELAYVDIIIVTAAGLVLVGAPISMTRTRPV